MKRLFKAPLWMVAVASVTCSVVAGLVYANFDSISEIVLIAGIESLAALTIVEIVGGVLLVLFLMFLIVARVHAVYSVRD